MSSCITAVVRRWCSRMEQIICHSVSVINLALTLVFALSVAVAELDGVVMDVVWAGAADDTSNAAEALPSTGTLILDPSDSGRDAESETNGHKI